MSQTRVEKKVSVIIPTYNRASFLPKAVESIIKQQYDNIEIIIVDDGSTDNTKSVVKTLTDKYSSIVYCTNLRSKGPSGARNTGILMALGEYVAFLDSDDVWLKGHLTNGIQILNDNSEVDLIFGNYEFRDYLTDKSLGNFFDHKKILFFLNSSSLSNGIKILRDNLFRALIKENFFSCGTSIIRKSKLENILFDESLTFSEDRDFAIRLYKKANAQFVYREEPFYIAYRHDSNLTSEGNEDGILEQLKNHISLFTKYLTTYNFSRSERSVLHEAISHRFLGLSYVYRKSYRQSDAFISIIKGAKYNFSLKHLIEITKILVNPMVFLLDKTPKARGL